MWEIYEHQGLARKLNKTPLEVLERDEKWKDIVRLSGPQGLRLIKGFHDEALRGEWKGFRSSRLGKQYRILYRVENRICYVKVLDINPHDYRRK